jgi:glutamyl-tRNA reductase
MSEVTLECLRAEGVQSSVVANRTFARARGDGQRAGAAVAIHFDDFESRAAGRRHRDLLDRRAASRAHARAAPPRAARGAARPLCIIDIASRATSSRRSATRRNVFLYNIDDLQQIVGVNLDRRRAAATAGRGDHRQAVEEYWSWYTGLGGRADDPRPSQPWRGAAARRARARAAAAGAPGARGPQAIDAMTRALLNKLLHAPTVRLREAAGNGRGTRCSTPSATSSSWTRTPGVGGRGEPARSGAARPAR